MGILRFLLAMAVFLGHLSSSKTVMVSGPIAVKAFFMISGFYMALILNEKYVGFPGAARLFWSNRLLRLFPTYLVVLAGVLLVCALIFGASGGRAAGLLQPALDAHRAGLLTLPLALSLTLSNLFIVGQDAALFWALDPVHGGLHWTPQLAASDGNLRLYAFMLIQPAWSLALELYFYALAPLLVPTRRWKLLATLVGASFALRALLYAAGLRQDPWSYRFFPLELAFFGLGALGYSAYRRLLSRPLPVALSATLFGLTLALTLTLNLLARHGLAKTLSYLMFLAVVMVSIPVIFAWTKNWKWDRALGELSFPLYLVHKPILDLLKGSGAPHWASSAPFVIALSLLVAVAVNFAVVRPIEGVRARRSRREIRTVIP